MKNQTKSLWLLCLAFLLLSPVLSSASKPATSIDAYNPNELSYGLYWFGLNGANQKFVPGEVNAYFESTKPTLIFAHGWQPFLSNSLPNFFFDGTDTAAAWINSGWNVGIFVWNQFSDETEGLVGGDDWFPGGEPPDGVRHAEAKIWTPDGQKGMRWRDWDDYIDGYSDPPLSTPSAAELFYQEYVAAMTEEPYTGGIIRIAGHSLGNQMATRFTKLVHDGITAGEVPEHLRPTRVALLDPYWSPGAKDYLNGKTNAEMVREYIAELLPTGTLFEWYWSSEWTTPAEGDANDPLKPMVLYAEMDPDYAASGKDKHMAAQHLYFWSYAFDGPTACTGDGCLDMDKLLSRTGDDQLAAVMRSDYSWAQDGGNLTSTPGDDTYQSQIQPGAPYTVTQLVANPPIQDVGGIITLTATVENDIGLVGDGILVAFDTNLGVISPRSVTSGGLALAHIASDESGVAHVTATARGTGGPVQSTAVVTFGDCITPLTSVRVEGPLGVTGTLYLDTLYTFAAAITPTDATPPITYTWLPEPVNGQGTYTATYRWDTPGVYTLTLVAENCGNTASDTHVVTIETLIPGCPHPLEAVDIAGPTTGYTDTLYTFDAVTTPSEATEPITYTWSPEPASGQGESSAQYQWAISGTYTLSLTTENCGGIFSNTHIVRIEAPPPGCPRPLGQVDVTGPVSGYVNSLYVFTATIFPDNATEPITYTWEPSPVGSLLLPGQSIVTYTWDTAGSYVITLTAENCGGSDQATHTIQISEQGHRWIVYLPIVIRNGRP